MGVSYEYDTTIGEMIKDLQKLARKHGKDTLLSLPSPGHYDPNFEGRNSKLTAVFSERLGHTIIAERGIE